MGVAGSKASEVDAAEERTAVRRLLTASHISQGTKRRQTDQTASRSPKKRKATREPAGHQHIELAIRSPKPGPSKSSAGDGDGDAAPPKPADVLDTAPSTDIPTASSSSVATEPSQSDIDDPRHTTPDPIVETSQAIVASPQFQHTLQYLRQESEEVPSGWAVAATAPISQSQRDHNLAMIRKAAASLQTVHLSSTYRKDNLRLATTIMPIQDTTTRSRALRRASLQPPNLPAILRGSLIAPVPDLASLGPVAIKRPGAKSLDARRSHKRVRRAFGEEKRSELVRRQLRKLNGLWRKDEWAGWSGLLRKEM